MLFIFIYYIILLITIDLYNWYHITDLIAYIVSYPAVLLLDPSFNFKLISYTAPTPRVGI